MQLVPSQLQDKTTASTDNSLVTLEISPQMEMEHLLLDQPSIPGWTAQRFLCFISGGKTLVYIPHMNLSNRYNGMYSVQLYTVACMNSVKHIY